MTGRGLLDSLAVCRLLLGGASLLVPRPARAEWRAEWEAELWQVMRAQGGGRDQAAGQARAANSPAAFCLGAFQDAWWLRENAPPARSLLQHGSPAICLLSLAGWAAASLALALSLPNARKAVLPPPYPDADRLVMISPAGASIGPANSPLPSIPLADYRSWQTSTRRLFSSLAFYQPLVKRVRIAPHRAAELSIVRATANLFDILRIPLPSRAGQSGQPMPDLLLGERAWRRYFDSDPAIAGRVVEIAGHPVRIAGVLSAGAFSRDQWRLPGRADAWMLADPQINSLPANSKGFVLAAMRPTASSSATQSRHWMTVYGADGQASMYECVSLAEQTRQPFSIYLFALFVAVLALPATTPLPLGDYPARAERLGWSVRARRWLFLAAKVALILPLVYCASIDLAYSDIAAAFHAVGPDSAQYLQLAGSFFGLLFAFRWILRDQRARCPVCLRRLSHPARVGEASRNFLAWNGTELICAGGHGLLHIPEIPTSWFSTQRWLYLDPSWSGLFSDGYAAPARV